MQVLEAWLDEKKMIKKLEYLQKCVVIVNFVGRRLSKKAMHEWLGFSKNAEVKEDL